MSWQTLLRNALSLLERGLPPGVPAPSWSFGGGTVLMLRYEHRVSQDIDLFLRDPQYLTALSPRLNGVAATLTEHYEEASSYLKLRLPEGEIDFIVAPRLSSAADEPFDFEGTIVQRESPIEVAAKKAFYRAAELRIRDVFDLAFVLSSGSQGLDELSAIVASKRDVLLRRLAVLAPVFAERAAAELDVLPAGLCHIADAPMIVQEWLGA